MKIAVYAIAKNEAKFAERWAECTQDADWRTVVVDWDTEDNTASLLRSAGVNDVVLVNYNGSFRFDTARNWALRHVPKDIDLCISLDMDEVLEPGFIENLRKSWNSVGPFDKAMPELFTSAWWRCDRVHAREGYLWIGPCHETTVWQKDSEERVVLFDGRIMHTPDETKPRSNYLPLLRLGVKERPHDVRSWTYMARELFTTDQPKKEIMRAINSALPLDPPEHERALLCRMAAITTAGQWLELAAARDEPEALHDLAKHEMSLGHFRKAAHLAEKGHRSTAPAHYLTSQDVREWGCADIASHCYASLGELDSALQWARTACEKNPALVSWLETVERALAQQRET